MFWLQGGDITVRNNVVDLQGVSTTTTYTGEQLVWHTANMASAPTLNDDRIHVLNNTVYHDERTGGGVPVLQRRPASGSSHVCRNNLAWLPNQTGARRIDDGGAWSSANNLFAGPNPFVAVPPQQGAGSIASFQLAGSGLAVDGGYDYPAGDPTVRLDAGNRCRPADGPGRGRDRALGRGRLRSERRERLPATAVATRAGSRAGTRTPLAIPDARVSARADRARSRDLDLVGAGVDLQHLGVAGELLDLVLGHVAVAAEELHRLERHLDRRLRRVELHRRRLGEAHRLALRRPVSIVAEHQVLDVHARHLHLARASPGSAGTRRSAGRTARAPARTRATARGSAR